MIVSGAAVWLSVSEFFGDFLSRTSDGCPFFGVGVGVLFGKFYQGHELKLNFFDGCELEILNCFYCISHRFGFIIHSQCRAHPCMDGMNGRRIIEHVVFCCIGFNCLLCAIVGDRCRRIPIPSLGECRRMIV